MPTLPLLFLCALLLGAATGYLFRFTSRGPCTRLSTLLIIGMLGGATGLILFQVLVYTTGAPLWLLPLLIISQVWLWLGPLGPKQRAG
ncbi:hypothetical protein CPA45_01695 [Vreelandella nigrificans]|uniref:GlsB/YeaQ/YmgE family stress response membrane protein n=1 Tax=Vreelandella nigrificans TaxID=2042704 RepID=A0A2A4HTR4_9GAMM|nr:hypothetical protein CPA45_01695 [Halomonas nigrificans]